MGDRYFRNAKERWMLRVREDQVPEVSTVPTVKTNPHDIQRLTGLFFGRLGHHRNVVLDRNQYVQEFIAAWHSDLTGKVRLEPSVPEGRFITRAAARNALGGNAAPAAVLDLLGGNVADAADYLQVSRDLVVDIRNRHEAQSRSMSNILRHCPEFRIDDNSLVCDLETYLERKPAGVSPKFLAFCIQTNSKARFGVSFSCARHEVPPLNTFRAAPAAHTWPRADTSWRAAFLCAYQGHGVVPLSRVPRDPASMTPGMTPNRV